MTFGVNLHTLRLIVSTIQRLKCRFAGASRIRVGHDPQSGTLYLQIRPRFKSLDPPSEMTHILRRTTTYVGWNWKTIYHSHLFHFSKITHLILENKATLSLTQYARLSREDNGRLPLWSCPLQHQLPRRVLLAAWCKSFVQL